MWDITPGYLNRQCLLEEHRDLHQLYTVLVHGEKNPLRHSETLRWVDCVSGLARRQALVVAEIHLRGCAQRSPVPDAHGAVRWPEHFETPPAMQYALLKSRHQRWSSGRIPLPRNAQELWAQHKYSVMARDPATYRAIGRRVSGMGRDVDFPALAEELALILREPPQQNRMFNALEHMWGYVSDEATDGERKAARTSISELFSNTVELTVRLRQPYLMASTALSDFAVFIGDR